MEKPIKEMNKRYGLVESKSCNYEMKLGKFKNLHGQNRWLEKNEWENLMVKWKMEEERERGKNEWDSEMREERERGSTDQVLKSCTAQCT